MRSISGAVSSVNTAAVAIVVTAAIGVPPSAGAQQSETAPPITAETRKAKLIDSVFDYLNMADGNALAFKPLTQSERTREFGKAFTNPIWYAKGALSAGQNQWLDNPTGWEQGASGYGKRYADIMGQYAIRKTVMYGLESLLQEDNRYFSSHRTGFWPRTADALSSGILARKANGQRYPSASLLVGFASGAYLSRFWHPSDTRSVGDAAVSFGVAMGWNIGMGVIKEFLPDLLRPITRKRSPTNSVEPGVRMPLESRPSATQPVSRRTGLR